MERPERWPWPLLPRVEVLPMPEPWPRPTRLSPWVAPTAARSSCSFMVVILLLGHRHEVTDLVHHPADGGGVEVLDARAHLAQAQRHDDGLLVLVVADRALGQGDRDLLVSHLLLSSLEVLDGQ